MTGDCHARFCGSRGVRFPPATRLREARQAGADGPSAVERAEIRELRKELERVTRERDILAKAVAFFSGSTRNNG